MNGFGVQLFEGIDLEVRSGHSLEAQAGYFHAVRRSAYDTKLRRLTPCNMSGRNRSSRGNQLNLDWGLDAPLVVGANTHHEISVVPDVSLRDKEGREQQEYQNGRNRSSHNSSPKPALAMRPTRDRGW